MSGTGYPWQPGEPLLAADLNAAIANSVALGGGALPLNGSAPMTGPLTLAGNATQPLHAVPLQQLNAATTVTTGAGTAARTLSARFGEVLNVKDYGAFGDGVTNDRFAISAALTAASTGNIKTVYFPPSATPYMCGPNVTVPSGVTLFAYPGTATIMSTSTNGSTPLLLSMEAAQHDIMIYGLTFDGNVAGQTGTGGARNGTRVNGVVGASRVVFDHCRFQNTYGQALQFANSTIYSGVRHSTFDNVGMYWHTSGLVADGHQGVTFTELSESTSILNFCESNTFTNIGSDCINLAYQTGMSVRGNRGYLNNQQFINAGIGCALVFSYGGRGTQIVDNNGFDATGHMYDLSAENALLVVGNKSYKAGQCGISIGTGANYGITTGCHHVIIVGNVSMNSGQQGALRGAGLGFQRGAGTSGNVTDVAVSGNMFSDDQSTPTQAWGIASFDTGSGLPTLVNCQFDPSNHMDGNVTASFGSGLGYSNPAGYQTAAQVTATFGAPPAIGNTTPASGAFTTLAASGVTALSSGVSFGSPVVTGVDLSKHIALFGTNNGINYVSPNLNFVVNGTTQATLSTAAMVLTGNLRINGNVGFFNSSAAAKPTVSGAKGSNVALGSLIAAFVSLGLITDTTTA